MPSECPRMYRLSQAALLLSLCFLAPLSGAVAQSTQAKPPALFTPDASRIAASSSASVSTRRMPLPPPPAAALISTG